MSPGFTEMDVIFPGIGESKNLERSIFSFTGIKVDN